MKLNSSSAGLTNTSQEDVSTWSLLLPLIAVISGMIMVILDGTVVNVAVPMLVELFETDLLTFQWVITGYTLAMSAVIPIAGWLTDRFGSKQVFLLTVIAFTVSSALCAAATTIEQLIAYRIIQGLSGGMVTPIGLAMVYRMAPPERRGRILGILGIPMLLAPAIGPLLSGWLLQKASWHWIFLLNVPVGMIAVWLGLTYLPKTERMASQRLDYMGLLLAPMAFTLLTFGLSEGAKDWTSASTLFTLIGGTIALVLFVVNELRHPHPLLELRVFRSSYFNRAVIILWGIQIALFSSMLLIPLYLQNSRGLSPLETGMLLLVHAIASGGANVIGGRWFDKSGVRSPALLGLSLIAAALLILCRLSLTPPIGIVIASVVLLGLGTGITMMPLNTYILNAAPAHLIPRVTPLTVSSQQIVISLGVAGMTGFLDSRISAHQAQTDEVMNGMEAEVLGFGDAFLLAACIILICVILSLLLRKPPAEEVHRGQEGRSQLAD